MKKVLLGIGLALHIIYYVHSILSLCYNDYRAFDYWLKAMVIAMPVVAVYFIDAIKSLVNKTTFNIIKLTTVIISIPLLLFVGCTLDTVCSIIWNSYFVILFLLETISLFIKSVNNSDTMKIFEQFTKTKPITMETEFVKIYKLSHNNKDYEIIIPKRTANRHSIIHCIDDYIAWEQAPLFPRLVGRIRGIKTPICKFAPKKDCATIFVIKGKPNGITGLDDGIFRSALKFDKEHINVMTLASLKSGEFNK